jgi:phosphatidylserine/phosphatidylglycerophosphate/cardiolipin synthase-like enzyme
VGKKGSLHVKCAVADGIRLYLSSANLTEFAMTLNMEMGILLEDKDLPFRIKNVFEDLISDGTLSEIGIG